jgi:hypothetical protein
MVQLCGHIWTKRQYKHLALAGYDGWYDLDLFSYRDDPVKYMKLSVENLNLTLATVGEMKKRGSGNPRAQAGTGPEMVELVRDSIRSVK